MVLLVGLGLGPGPGALKGALGGKGLLIPVLGQGKHLHTGATPAGVSPQGAPRGPFWAPAGQDTGADTWTLPWHHPFSPAGRLALGTGPRPGGFSLGAKAGFARQRPGPLGVFGRRGISAGNPPGWRHNFPLGDTTPLGLGTAPTFCAPGPYTAGLFLPPLARQRFSPGGPWGILRTHGAHTRGPLVPRGRAH